MKRDFDLAREILRQVEASEKAVGVGWIDLKMEGKSPIEVSYHVQLMDEAGLIEAQNLTTMGGFDWRPKRLTWAGHEFLDLSRDEDLWKKAKGAVREKLGQLSFEMLRVVLSDMAKSALGSGT
jgi:hypothetical protein